MNWSDSQDAREMLRHLAGHADRRVLVLATYLVAETALPYCDDDIITACVWAIDAARRWARGEANLDEVEAAWAAAEAAWAAAEETGAWAARAATWVGRVVSAAEEAARAAEAAWAAAAWAAAEEAYARRLHSLAILLRLHLPVDPAATTYAVWRGRIVCPEMIREQYLPEDVLVQWDADCERGAVPCWRTI